MLPALGSIGLARMKITIEHTVLNDRRLTRPTPNRGVKVITEREDLPEHADFPRQHIEFFVDDASDAARAICTALGVAIPEP
jgi:hypothetical protein